MKRIRNVTEMASAIRLTSVKQSTHLRTQTAAEMRIFPQMTESVESVSIVKRRVTAPQSFKDGMTVNLTDSAHSECFAYKEVQ